MRQPDDADRTTGADPTATAAGEWTTAEPQQADDPSPNLRRRVPCNANYCRWQEQLTLPTPRQCTFHLKPHSNDRRASMLKRSGFAAMILTTLVAVVIAGPASSASPTAEPPPAVVVHGDLVLVDSRPEVRTHPETGDRMEGTTSIFVPGNASEGSGETDLAGTCTVEGYEANPRVGFGQVRGYASLSVSSDCASAYGWSHKLFRLYGYNQFKQLGGTYNGSAGPGQIDYDTRSASCSSSAYHIYDNSHNWVGSPAQATLACYAP